MDTKSSVRTLDEAVLELVTNLPREKRAELAVLFINSLASWAWYEEVIDRFQLRDEDNPLIAEIDRRFPDEAAIKFLESDFSGPVFEAAVILREAKKLIHLDDARNSPNTTA